MVDNRKNRFCQELFLDFFMGLGMMRQSIWIYYENFGESGLILF